MKRKYIKRCVLVIFVSLFVSMGTAGVAEVPAEYQCSINWEQFQGETLDVLFCIHPWQESIEPLIPEFEKLTGIKVRLAKLPELEYLTKVPADFTAGTFAFDVFMSQYYDAPKYQLEKWTAPLERYFEDEKLTDTRWYEWKDFFPAARNVATIGGKYMDRIAITSEAQVLIFRKDLYAKLGLLVPTDFDELLQVAKTLTEKGNTYGITLRGGTANWWPLYGVLKSHGGEYFTPDGRTIRINSPGSVLGVKMYTDLAKYAPPGITAYDWDEINTAMLAGQAAMFLDSSVIYSRLQDPEKSTVVGKIAAAPFPKGPAGRIAHSHYWSISLSETSGKQEAGWLFVQWATSKPVQLKVALKGVLPPRGSIWKDPQFAVVYPEDFIKAVGKTLETAVISPAHLRFFELVDTLRAAVQEIMQGQKEVKPALDEVQAAWEKALS